MYIWRTGSRGSEGTVCNFGVVSFSLWMFIRLSWLSRWGFALLRFALGAGVKDTLFDCFLYPLEMEWNGMEDGGLDFASAAGWR
jgi:hypothetical protein